MITHQNIIQCHQKIAEARVSLVGIYDNIAECQPEFRGLQFFIFRINTAPESEK